MLNIKIVHEYDEYDKKAYSNDIELIQSIAGEMGYTLSQIEAFNLWKEYSWNSSAKWLIVSENIVRKVISNLEKEVVNIKQKEVIGFYGGKFLPFHRGHLDVILRASNMVDKLYVIIFSNEEEERNLCKDGKIKYEEITPKKRMEWISKAVKDMPNIKVFNITEGYGSWKEESKGVYDIIGRCPNFVFSSENDYSPIFEELYPTAKSIVFDRSNIDISGTLLRKEGVYKHWDMIPKSVQEDFVKKVVVIGTESCGKSTLTRNLAKAFNTEYVEEYGRTICEEFNGCDGVLSDNIYSFIAYGHKMIEYNKTKLANKVLFIDSEAIITQFYSNLYNEINQPVLDEIAKLQDYDLWIFLEPDVKWVDDGLRIHGDKNERELNNNKLKKMLEDRNISYKTISGDYSNRFNTAYELVEHLLK